MLLALYCLSNKYHVIFTVLCNAGIYHDIHWRQKRDYRENIEKFFGVYMTKSHDLCDII